jgi:hypothetical protein
VIATALPAALLPAAPALAAPTVSCKYRYIAWSSGFVADLDITNNGPEIHGWTARWTFNEPTANISVWQATLAVPDGRSATATNLYFNGTIRTGPTLNFGWSATAASTSAPTDITVNGVAC